MHYDLFHPLMCFEVAGRSSGLSSVGLLLGVPGFASVFSGGNSVF